MHKTILRAANDSGIGAGSPSRDDRSIEREEPRDMNEELRWMLASITHLLRARDYYGAFFMCLSAIEPLAQKRYPELGNGKRFQRFLHEERKPFWGANVSFPDATKCGHSPKINPPDLEGFEYDIERWIQALHVHLAETKKDLIPIELVLWKYCRNPIVHEGSRLAVDGETAVTLDWSVPPPPTFRVDQGAKNVIVISGPFLLHILYQIVAKHLGPSGCSGSPEPRAKAAPSAQ